MSAYLNTSAARVNDLIFSNTSPLKFILGQCSYDTNVLSTYSALVKILGSNFLFKVSWDKANRTSHGAYRGLGMGAFMEFCFSFPGDIITDVHTCAEVSKLVTCVDAFQIPALLCKQTDLLVEVGRTGKAVFIKKGQFASASDMLKAADKVGENVVLVERGTFFGYNDLVVDYRNIALMKERPVVLDITHSNNKQPAMSPHLARAATALGIAGIFAETHIDPKLSLSDGENMIGLDSLQELVPDLRRLDRFIKKPHERKEMYGC